MKITISPTNNQDNLSSECKHSIITIEHPDDDIDFMEVMQLVQSALIAWGFNPSMFEEN